jgi:O-acetyl-ADP-ribose deacetylase (regulator of RNase III)
MQNLHSGFEHFFFILNFFCHPKTKKKKKKMEEWKKDDVSFFHFKGSMMDLETDAVVNAANTFLLGGGGIDGIVHQTAGPILREYNRLLGGCKVGEAKISPGFYTKSRWIISTVGPFGTDKNREELLSQCYTSSLQWVEKSHLEPDFHPIVPQVVDLFSPFEKKPIEKIVFCGISTGIYGYDVKDACPVAIETCTAWTKAHPDIKVKIVFANFLVEEQQVYENYFEQNGFEKQ